MAGFSLNNKTCLGVIGVLILSVAGVCWIGGFDGSSSESRRGDGSQVSVCPTGASKRDMSLRWVIGPVAMVGITAPGEVFDAAWAHTSDSLVTEVKILVEFDPDVIGEEVVLFGRDIGPGVPARFTHAAVARGDGLEDAVGSSEVEATTSVPARAGGEDGWADLPGTVVFFTGGCYQLFATVGGVTYGPFGFMLSSPE